MIRKIFVTMMMVFVINLAFLSNPNKSVAQVKGEVPGKTLGLKSDADLWRYIKTGNAGSTQMKDELSAVMIQSEGENWRAIRNGPVTLYGALGLFAIIGIVSISIPSFTLSSLSPNENPNGVTISILIAEPASKVLFKFAPKGVDVPSLAATKYSSLNFTG